MLDPRAARTVWLCLGGVIVSEGWGLLAFFGRGPAFWPYVSLPSATAPAWVLAMLVAALYAGFAARSSGFIGAHMLHVARWRPFALLRLIAVPAALISGVFEEVFFRKIVMDAAMLHGAGLVVQLAASALLFGGAHIVWGLLGGGWRGGIGAVAATTVLGGLLGVVYAVGGRAIAPCIAAHAALNLLIEPWLLIAAVTQRWGPAVTD